MRLGLVLSRRRCLAHRTLSALAAAVSLRAAIVAPMHFMQIEPSDAKQCQ
jgi:hypothetical protein